MKAITTKTISLICALFLIISLASCGAKNDAEVTAAPTEPTAASTAAETPAPAKTEAATDAAIKIEAKASADTGLVGSWDYAELSGMIYTFNTDGSGTYDMFGEAMHFTYEADGAVLKITYTDEGVDEPMELEYKIDGDTLNVKDSFGNDTLYKRK